jgi:microcystin-dependent protein
MSATSIGGYHVCVSPNGTDLPDAGSGGMPIGAISLWGTATAPANWLLCDGSYVSRSTYSDLFAVVGTTWGAGDGAGFAFQSTTVIANNNVLWFNVTAPVPTWYQTAGTKFTITGGAAGFSQYFYTITGYAGGQIFTTALDQYGVAPTFSPISTVYTAGVMTVTTPTYFTLPDTGNKTIRGTKNGTLAPNAQAGSDSTSVTLFAANLPPHRHGFTNYNTYTTSSTGVLPIGGSSVNTPFITNANQTYAEDGSTPVASLPFNVATTNPYIAIPFIIKYT